jgi:hypothetical protein
LLPFLLALPGAETAFASNIEMLVPIAAKPEKFELKEQTVSIGKLAVKLLDPNKFEHNSFFKEK